MEKSFCIHCGNKMEEGFDFCNNCGKPSSKEVIETKKVTQQQAPKSSIYQKYKASPKTRIYSGIIIALIVTPVVIFSILTSIHVDLGTLEFEVDSFAELNMDLIIDNSVGITEIYYDSTITNLFEATLNVRGKPGADISNAVNFQQVNDTGKIIVSFDSGDYNSWNWKSLRYNIVIRIHTSALVDFDIEGSTGTVLLDLEGYDDLVLKDVQLTVSTGKIQFYSGASVGTNMGDVRLQASTGTILYDSVNAINTTMTDFWVYSSTGSQDIYFGERTTIDDISATFTASTGNIEIHINEMLYIYNFTWDIEVTTGRVDVYIDQTIVSENITVDFDILASTGTIEINYEIDTDIGIRIITATSTGSINIPGSGTIYETEGYSTDSNKYNFNLETSTGNIRVFEL